MPTVEYGRITHIQTIGFFFFFFKHVNSHSNIGIRKIITQQATRSFLDTFSEELWYIYMTFWLYNALPVRVTTQNIIKLQDIKDIICLHLKIAENSTDWNFSIKTPTFLHRVKHIPFVVILFNIIIFSCNTSFNVSNFFYFLHNHLTRWSFV